jgi:hypothetical protein
MLVVGGQELKICSLALDNVLYSLTVSLYSDSMYLYLYDLNFSHD